jgi:hypothetical protein
MNLLIHLRAAGSRDFSRSTAENVRVTTEHPSAPLEIRVLETLTSGPLTVAEVALRTGEPETVVGPVLDQRVLDQVVTRIKLAAAPAYSLTPMGLHAIALHQRAHGGVDHGAGVPEVATSSALGEYAADATPEQPAPLPSGVPSDLSAIPTGPRLQRAGADSVAARVRWRYVLYAVAYVLLGMLILVFLHSVVGVLAILVGLVLGGWTLRPLLASPPGR